MSDYLITYSDGSEKTLMHYGVQGMKWGIRRYRNKDGTLTNAGKKRYLDKNGVFNRKRYSVDQESEHNAIVDATRSIKNISSNSKRIYDRYKKNYMESPDHLTNDELKKRIDRMSLEQRYSELSSRYVTKGQKSVENAIDTIGDVAAIAGSIALIGLAVWKMREKLS